LRLDFKFKLLINFGKLIEQHRQLRALMIASVIGSQRMALIGRKKDNKR